MVTGQNQYRDQDRNPTIEEASHAPRHLHPAIRRHPSADGLVEEDRAGDRQDQDPGGLETRHVELAMVQERSVEEHDSGAAEEGPNNDRGHLRGPEAAKYPFKVVQITFHVPTTTGTSTRSARSPSTRRGRPGPGARSSFASVVRKVLCAEAADAINPGLV